MRVGAAGLGEAVADLRVHVAGGEGVELLLGHAPLLVVTDDGQLVHVVGLLGEEGLRLVPQHPAGGLPDVLVHGRRYRTDHPAVSVAVADLGAHGLGLFRVPQRVPGLLVEVPHDLLVPGTIARHDVAVGIDEERVESHVTRQQPRLPVDVVDEPVIEIGTKPLLRLVGLKQLVYQRLEVLRHHRPVVDNVLGLHEVEAVVQGCCGKLHTELVRELIEGNQVRRVPVLHRHAESDVRMLSLHELLERLVAPPKAVRQAANLVVCVLQALDGDADAYFRELLAQIHDAVGEVTVGGDHDAVRFLIKLPHDIFQVRTDEGLPSRDVGKVHPRKLLYRLERQLLLRTRGRLVAAAHSTARVAPIGHNDGTIELLFSHSVTFLPSRFQGFFVRWSSSRTRS